jgi:hypothetical protein
VKLIVVKGYLIGRNLEGDLPVNSCDVDPPFLHVDPLGKRAINVRA